MLVGLWYHTNLAARCLASLFLSLIRIRSPSLVRAEVLGRGRVDQKLKPMTPNRMMPMTFGRGDRFLALGGEGGLLDCMGERVDG
jgi:hypothetical protein